VGPPGHDRGAVSRLALPYPLTAASIAFAPKRYSWLARILHARAGQPGQGERRKSATDVRLDGDEMAADADDGDASHATAAYISQWGLVRSGGESR
jgi:hypothetical protein